MVRVFRFIRPKAVAGLLAGVVLILPVVPVRAQAVDCESLRQQMAAATAPDPGREARFARAIAQQRTELARSQAYGDGVGCGGLDLFGAPAECEAIEARIARQQNNLASLEAQARLVRSGDPDRIGELTARFDAACRTDPDNSATVYADPGYIDGNGNASIADDPAEGARRPQGGSKAICVRSCDGGFFPLGSSVRNGDLDGLQALCSAQCPATEAKLYTTADTDDIAEAVALDGSPYSALPAAFRFQKTHDAACTCKPAGQSWVEALAKAEEMLDKTDTHDVTVTEKMSRDMARPTAPPTATPALPRKASRRKATGLDLPPPSLPETAQLGAQAGTPAGGDPASAAPTPRRNGGAARSAPGADGVSPRRQSAAPGF